MLIALLSELFFGKTSWEEKRQTTSLSAIINKRNWYGVIEEKPKHGRKPQLYPRLRSICTKLYEGIVRAGTSMAVGTEKIADFTVDNYAALKLQHPQRETCSVPDPTDTDCCSTSELFVHKALMSFPNSLSAGLDGISPHVLKDLTAKSNGVTGLNYLRASKNLVNVILIGKEDLIALKKPHRGLRIIAVGNICKICRHHVFESRQARYRSRQVRVGIKRGAELASHISRCLIESLQPKENVLLKIDVEFDKPTLNARENF